jgi:hypothetical protein
VLRFEFCVLSVQQPGQVPMTRGEKIIRKKNLYRRVVHFNLGSLGREGFV